MDESWRMESDSMGSMRVPAGAYYGAQTARAVENFPVSGLRFPRPFVRALGLIKKHAALTNAKLGLLPQPLANSIAQAAREVAEGTWDAEFVVDVFQTGSGTSTNMNANEVIANRASELLGGNRGDGRVHPNDEVNLGQSSNDVIPSAIHLAVLDQLYRHLKPSLQLLRQQLKEKAKAFADVTKIGRTHLQDAVPMQLGDEFGGYARQIELSLERIVSVEPRLRELPLGGTAIGTGLNTHPEFATRVIEGLQDETGLELKEAANHFEAQAARDACVELSGSLKVLAVSLIKIANDIRWLGSGPRLGLEEIKLPATQPGSSIMPGKVNPVMCEMVLQVAAQVIGNDTTIAWAGAGGHFELNAMMPVLAHNLLESIQILGNACDLFARRCIAGIEVDRERCAAGIERSLALVTALVPAIGYERAAAIAKVAYETNRTIREVALEISGLDSKRIDALLALPEP